jgi:hypothetical protein
LETNSFDTFYAQHPHALKLRDYCASTIDVYARAVRCLTDHFDTFPFLWAPLNIFASSLSIWIAA